MNKSRARTVTASGNIIYQRTQRGWINSLGLWPLLMPIGGLLFLVSLPPEPPYFDTAIYGAFALLCIWRVFNASRTVLVALSDSLMQYHGMGGPWEVIYRDLDGVDLTDEVSSFALRTSLRRKHTDDLPRYLVLTHRSGRQRNINLTWFEGAALLGDLEARLPERVKRGERYRQMLAALEAAKETTAAD
ncbi:MAG: hypothetical protein JXB47_21070 [Anaerolineae bacterium]|nr:hypothetical protein [Anaerolineae bacterium]